MKRFGRTASGSRNSEGTTLAGRVAEECVGRGFELDHSRPNLKFLLVLTLSHV